MHHELFLTARQKAEIRNAFVNNMSMDTKLSKAQLPFIIQSGRFLWVLLRNSWSIDESCYSFVKHVLAPLAMVLFKEKCMGKKSQEEEKESLYSFQMKLWICYNHEITRKFRCITWWSYQNNKTWNKKKRRQTSSYVIRNLLQW